jgi:hypothetical protein
MLKAPGNSTTGGGGLTIGGAVISGTPNSVLYIDASGNLAQHPDFVHDGALNRFGVGGTTPLARAHFTSSNLIASPTLADGLLLENDTPATLAVPNQWSPGLYLRSRAWATGVASRTMDGILLVQPVSAATPTGQMIFGFSLNGAAYTNGMILTSAGSLQAFGSLLCNGSFYNAGSPTAANLWINSASSATQTNASGIYFGTSGFISLRTAFNGTTGYTVPRGNIHGNVLIGAMTVTEASSGTHPVMANLIVRSPVFTNGGAASTDLCTVYIEGPPTGTATSTNGNLALLIPSGNTRMGGMLSVGASTAPNLGLLQLGPGGGAFAVIGFSATSADATSPIRDTMDYNRKVWSLTANDGIRRTVATWIIDRTPVTAPTPVPTAFYGSSGANILGDPNGWFETLKADGTTVVVPYYNLG